MYDGRSDVVDDLDGHWVKVGRIVVRLRKNFSDVYFFLNSRLLMTV